MNRTRRPPLAFFLLLAACACSCAAAADTASDIRQLTGELERARRKASYDEWLYTEGVLARSETEQAALLVFRLRNDLEAARLRQAKESADLAQRNFAKGNAGKEENDKARAALATQATSADVAHREWKHAEMEDALLNLKRQQKLNAEGIAPKSDVRRAQDAVSALQAEPK